jgi:hypothetical protein
LETLDALGEQLDEALHILQQRWQQTRDAWDDQVRDFFDNTYWQPLHQQTQLTRQHFQVLARAAMRSRSSGI